jgi:hypothetical protein
MALEEAIPALDVGHGLAETLVIADGGVHGVEATLAHLAEDRLRPVVVLQAVDANG